MCKNTIWVGYIYTNNYCIQTTINYEYALNMMLNLHTCYVIYLISQKEGLWIKLKSRIIKIYHSL